MLKTVKLIRHIKCLLNPCYIKGFFTSKIFNTVFLKARKAQVTLCRTPLSLECYLLFEHSLIVKIDVEVDLQQLASCLVHCFRRTSLGHSDLFLMSPCSYNSILFQFEKFKLTFSSRLKNIPNFKKFQKKAAERFSDLGTLNFNFRLEPIFNTALAPSKNTAQFKSGQN